MIKELRRKRTSHSALLGLTLLPLALTGCIEYQAKPLDPLLISQQFEQRRLDSPGLRRFIEQHDAPLSSWPPAKWSFKQLTLAGFYFHPDLDVARADWQIAAAARSRLGQRPNPQLGVTPTYNASNSSPSPWILSSLLDFTIELGDKRQIRQEQAEQQSESARLTLAAQAWQIRSRIRQSLTALQNAEQRQQLLQQQQSLQQESSRRIEQQYAVGNLSALERSRARLAATQARLDLLDAERQSSDARIQLAAALGLYPEALRGVAFDFSELMQQPEPASLNHARQQALQNHAGLLKALADYAASEQALRLAVAKQYPDLQIGPGYEYDQGANKWILGFSLPLPLFHNYQADISEAEAQRSAAAARFEALQLTTVEAVERALSNYRAAEKKRTDTDLIHADAANQLRRAQARLAAGELAQSDLVAVRLELSAASLARLTAQSELQTAQNALEDTIQSPLGLDAASWQQSPRAHTDNGRAAQ